LKTKEGEKEVFKLARARERSTRDLGVVRCIKDENGRVLSRDAEIKGRWQRYFFRLLNGKRVKALEVRLVRGARWVSTFTWVN